MAAPRACHGLRSRRPLIKTEDPVEYDAHVAAYIQVYKPEGKFQEDLVQRLANIAWRLRRIATIEAQVWEELARRECFYQMRGENDQTQELVPMLMQPTPALMYGPDDPAPHMARLAAHDGHGRHTPSALPVRTADDEQSLFKQRREWMRAVHEAQVTEWAEAFAECPTPYGPAAMCSSTEPAFRVLQRQEMALQKDLFQTLMLLEHVQDRAGAPRQRAQCEGPA